MYCNVIFIIGFLVASLVYATYAVFDMFAQECEKQCAKRRHE